MQAAKKVAEEVLRCRPVARLGNGVQYEYQK